MKNEDDDNDNDGAQVISLFERALPVVSRPTPLKARGCTHMQIEIDEHERLVTCRTCGARLDAFAWLMHLASHWDRYRMRAAEAAALRTRVDELKAEEKRLLGRVSRLRGKADSPSISTAPTAVPKRG